VKPGFLRQIDNRISDAIRQQRFAVDALYCLLRVEREKRSLRVDQTVSNFYFLVLVHEPPISGLCALRAAELRMSADQYEIVFSRAVGGRSSPVGRMGAAAPIALTGAMKMCCVARAISEPADPAFVLMNV